MPSPRPSGKKTKAVLINSPNNPTGQIYGAESLHALGALLEEKSREHGKIIYLLSDEPYRKIVYDGAVVPSVFACYSNSILATSYSKDISIPGERLGFLAVNPAATHGDALMGGMALANRILGFVNAPALMQRVVSCIQGLSVDIAIYKRKRDLLCDGLADAGYDFTMPPGAFYLFPRSPVPDDVEFVRTLQQELILAVPGSGFMGPGFFRLAYCVDDDTIINALPGVQAGHGKGGLLRGALLRHWPCGRQGFASRMSSGALPRQRGLLCRCRLPFWPHKFPRNVFGFACYCASEAGYGRHRSMTLAQLSNNADGT